MQLTAVIVPVLESAAKKTLPPKGALGACGLALVGIVLLATDGGGGGGGGGSAVPATAARGDLLVAAASVAYSLHVVRLGEWAPKLPALALARSKELAKLIFSVVTLAATCAFVPGQLEASGAFLGSAALGGQALAVAAAVVVWNGAAVTAFASFAQTFGQAAVRPSTANAIYASQPLWSAVFAFALLGETLAGQSLAGAGVLLGAVLLAVFSTGTGTRGDPDPASDGDRVRE